MMRLSHPSLRRRRGIAAVEVAVVLPVLLALLLGIWEVGRVFSVQNILDNAAREGARLTSTAAYWASNNHTDPSTSATTTLPSPSTNADYEVQKKVLTYLSTAGLDTSQVTVTVQNLGQTGKVKSWSYTYPVPTSGSGNTGSDPGAVADQLDHLRVTVTIPYSSVRWTPTSLFVSSSTVLTATSDWYSMRNVPLSISTTIPSKPLKTGDTLP
jgi:Flp pilus assembly protein TadG